MSIKRTKPSLSKAGSKKDLKNVSLMFNDATFKKNLDLSLVNYHKPLLRTNLEIGNLISKLESLPLIEFNMLDRNNQAKILMSYSRVKKIVEKNASKYYKSNGHSIRLEKANFDGLLLETITKVLNKVEESKVQSKLHKNRKMKSDPSKDFEFKSIKDIFGYLTNAFVQNVKKNYVPEKTKKRTALSIVSSSLVASSSNNLHDVNNNILDSYGATNTIVDYENQKSIKLMYKTLQEYDYKNKDEQHIKLADLFESLLSNPNHAEIARNLNIQAYVLNKHIIEIKKQLENNFLIDNLRETLSSIIEENEDDKSSKLMSDNVINSSIEYAPPCISHKIKENKYEIVIKAYQYINNKKVESKDKTIVKTYPVKDISEIRNIAQKEWAMLKTA
jgi:hypothetical protein